MNQTWAVFPVVSTIVLFKGSQNFISSDAFRSGPSLSNQTVFTSKLISIRSSNKIITLIFSLIFPAFSLFCLILVINCVKLENQKIETLYLISR